MQKNQSSFVERAYNPILQMGIVFIGVILMMSLLKIFIWSSSTIVSNRAFWIIASTGILFFALFNSIISLAVKDMSTYWTRSTLAYTALMISCGFLAYIFSSLTITEAGSFKWIFMVFTFGYLLFLSMMRFMRKIVQIAQKEDDKWMSRRK